ncbi:MAG: radical SAM protein [Alphaproteobacteria bacterium]|nr:radical SAM protein [Alphaproteobacteria bacterium]
MHELVFVVKLSKFCNLRCAYCYEHRELHVRDRMHPGTLQKLFAGVDAFGDHLATLGITPEFSFVWHGGEPLLLPKEFYRHIASTQEQNIHRHPYRNSVQTNLYGVKRDSLDYVLTLNWELGVSIDFADGVRRNVGGRESNGRVIAAAEALRARGHDFGVISVLGNHNRGRLTEAYDWIVENAVGWRILPMFEGGPAEATSMFRLPAAEVARTLIELLTKRAESERHLPVEPLDTYLRAAVLRILDQPGAGDPARTLLDNIYVVNVNGDVFLRPFAYDPARRLGNLATSSILEMTQAGPYHSCQDWIVARKRHHCLSCDHVRFCDSTPMHEHGSVVCEAGKTACGVPRLTISAIISELAAAGVDAGTVGGWAREWLMQSPRAA